MQARKTLVVGLLVCSATAYSQQDFSSVEIQAVPVATGLFMLVGQGGNIALSIGDDGTFIVDSQFAPLSEKIQSAIRAAGGGDVDFLVNTHWHGDHSGGNENFGAAGAVIMAQDNVRERMGSEQVMASLGGDTVPPSPAVALPIVTYPSGLNFHFNGEDVEIFHAPSAHTDGDSIVHFTNLNAFHMGDAFLNGGYPFIDVSSGGSLEGIVAAAEAVLSRSNAETVIIPGHGALASPEELRTYHDVLAEALDRFQTLIDQGLSEDQVVAANPTAEWDDQWGGGFMNAETFTRLAYQSLTR